jgi:hypothetical protein
METHVLQWVNLIVDMLLTFACVGLYADNRGRREGLRALEVARASLERQTVRQQEIITILARLLAVLAPGHPLAAKEDDRPGRS